MGRYGGRPFKWGQFVGERHLWETLENLPSHLVTPLNLLKFSVKDGLKLGWIGGTSLLSMFSPSSLESALIAHALLG